MTFSAAWKNEADDAFGEALSAKVWVRCDTDGGSNQLVELTAQEALISVSPLVRKRERDEGVIQGMTWTVKFDHTNSVFNPAHPDFLTTEDFLEMNWGCVELGFEGADEWELFAQGKIVGVNVDANSVCTLTFHEPIMDLLTNTIPRDIFYDGNPWVSLMKVRSKAAASSEYDNANYPLQITAAYPFYVSDETFVVEFKSATTYDIRYEDGTYETGGPWSITADHQVVSNILAFGVVTIYTAGWDQTPNAYAGTDEFVFYTSKPRSTLDPINVIQDILNNQLDLQNGSYNVKSGAAQSIYYDLINWAAVAGQHNTTVFKGYWEAGTNAVDMIQDVLLIINGTLYPSRTGQIGIWALDPSAASGAAVGLVTGDPTDSNRSIIAARRKTSEKYLANHIQISYLDLKAGADAEEYAIDTASVYRKRRKSYTCGWRVTGSAVDSACSRRLNRYRVPVRVYELTALLRLLSYHDLGDLLELTEPGLDETLTRVQVAQITVDMARNLCRVHAWSDAIINETYAVVGDAGTDPIGSTVGGSDKVW